MKIRILGLILLLFMLGLIISSCSSSPTSTAPVATTSLDGATLLQERCTVCHPLSNIERKGHTAADWKIIVDTMISRGAQLSSSEETVVVNYLAANFGQ